VSWNYNTNEETFHEDFTINKATNFVLDLQEGYANINRKYGRDLLKNLQRSSKFKLLYTSHTDYKKCIKTYKELYGKRIEHVTENDYLSFEKICSEALQKNMLVCRDAVDETGDLLATALLLNDGKRLYNIMNSTTDAGRKKEANHFLLDNIIKEFSGTGLVFDFEGTDLPGVKPFYENLGPVNQPYYMIKYNKLPWPYSLFKK
jgi:hypothetical protein